MSSLFATLDIAPEDTAKFRITALLPLIAKYSEKSLMYFLYYSDLRLMAMNYRGIAACRKPQMLAHQLAASKAQAAFLRKQLDDLALKLTHDFRSPLQSLIDYAELLVGETAGRLNQKQKRYMESGRTSIRKILQVLDSALELRAQGTVVPTRE